MRRAVGAAFAVALFAMRAAFGAAGREFVKGLALLGRELGIEVLDEIGRAHV